MSIVETGLSGTQVRHASRKMRHRFDRSWSVIREALIAHEEQVAAPVASDPCRTHPPFDVNEEEEPLECTWWLLIAYGAGRGHFGSPATTPISHPVEPINDEALVNAAWRSAAFEDLHQFLTDWPRQSRHGHVGHVHEQALVALSRHPFFQTPPPLGFETPAACILETIIAHQAFWLRDVADWNAPKADSDVCIADLFAHLFYLYEMPAWLDYRTMPSKASNRDPDWLALAQYVGRGGSLHRAAAYLFLDAKGKPLFTRRGIRYLREAPCYQTVQEAVYHAFVLQSGGDEVAVWDFHHYGLHPHLMYGAPVVRAVAPWLAQNRHHLAPSLGLLVVAWAFSEVDQRRIKARLTGTTAAPFSLKGRSARSVCADVFTSLSCPRHLLGFRLAHLLQWPSHGWNRTLVVDDTTWSFREICTLSDLARESEEMDHCVFQLLGQCASDQTLIFSLVSDRGDRVTLQICPATKILLQICGRTNREPSPAEHAAAGEWLQAIQNGWRDPKNRPHWVTAIAQLV